MERDRSQEMLSEQLAAILRAKNKVVQNIWKPILGADREIGRSVEYELNATQKINKPDLLKNEMRKMNQRRGIIIALARQSFVDIAFLQLMDRFKFRDGSPVLLFDSTATDITILKLKEEYSHEGELQMKIDQPDYHARHDIVQTIIPRSQNGFHNPIDSFSRIESIPTIIQRVNLRYPTVNDLSIVELVPQIT